MTGKLTAVCGIGLLAGAAAAQVPPDIAAKIRAAGQAMDPIAAGALYRPLFAHETYQGLTVTRDIAYGNDPLQKLDLYVPEGAKGPLPVLLFVHGGGFTRGDKHGEYYPDNITAWAARHRMIGVNVDYRLAPGTTFPGATQDLAAAIAWVLMQAVIVRSQGPQSRLRRALGRDLKGKLSPFVYLAGIALAFVHPLYADGLYAAVALAWLIPDRRMEAGLKA